MEQVGWEEPGQAPKSSNQPDILEPLSDTSPSFTPAWAKSRTGAIWIFFRLLLTTDS
jgi:hypothetical protein